MPRGAPSPHAGASLRLLNKQREGEAPDWLASFVIATQQAQPQACRIGIDTAQERTLFLEHCSDNHLCLRLAKVEVHEAGLKLIKPGMRCGSTERDPPQP